MQGHYAADIEISGLLCRAMFEHARREMPRECCGLLIGDAHAVREVFPARNELADSTRYRIDARDHFAAIRRARSLGLAVIGAYHSHPFSHPVPSSRDLDEASPDFLYVIASLGRGEDSEI